MKKDITVSEAVSEWLQSEDLDIKLMTRATYERMCISHVLPALGDKLISELTPALLEEYVTGKRAELSASSANIMGCVLRGTLRHAKEKYPLAPGCIEVIKTPLPRRNSTAEISVISRANQRALEAVLEGNHRYRIGILLTLYTGIRLGELCALRWRDFSDNYSTMRITAAVHRVRLHGLSGVVTGSELTLGTPKSETSVRTIPVPDKVVERLLPIVGAPDCFILNGTENIIDPAIMQNAFKRCLKEANVPHVKFHALRHTFATRWVEHGFDVKALSRILGHADIMTTMNIYVHPSLDTMRDLINQL